MSSSAPVPRSIGSRQRRATAVGPGDDSVVGEALVGVAADPHEVATMTNDAARSADLSVRVVTLPMTTVHETEWIPLGGRSGGAGPQTLIPPLDQVVTDINFLGVLETQDGVRHVDRSEARDLDAVVFAIAHENVQGGSHHESREEAGSSKRS